MFIRTERLFLRPGWAEDWNDLLDQFGDERIVRNLASAPWPYTAEAAREFASRPQAAHHPHFMVTLPGADGSRLIGSAALIATDSGTELGYWISRDHWGQGYATEAARAVLSLARTLRHGRIAAHHFVDNPASGRVLRKVGFTPTGQKALRWSVARGVESPAEVLSIDLSHPSDCNDTDVAAMRAA